MSNENEQQAISAEVKPISHRRSTGSHADQASMETTPHDEGVTQAMIEEEQKLAEATQHEEDKRMQEEAG